PVQMTLDPETANSHLYLSQDCKIVWYNSLNKVLPYNPKRFKNNLCVLGSIGFKSGRQYWDVDVHREGVWAIGVVKESVPRDRFLHQNFKDGLWALSHIQNRYVAWTSPEVTPLTLQRVPKRIRVCLDYEEGRVMFFDAETREWIFAFPKVSFRGERVFPLF
ncbi:BT1A1 protein, partial [Thinocorus orbignyianus]|nr:BT1A1 protein [Thinocorus orbignyianus]